MNIQFREVLCISCIALILLPLQTAAFCRPCSSRGRYSCFGDGCYTSNGRCRGFATCNNDGGGWDGSLPSCTRAYCGGDPTKDPCKDAVRSDQNIWDVINNSTTSTNSTNSTNTDDDDFSFDFRETECTLWGGFGCEWNKTTEVCELVPDPCFSLVFNYDSYDCSKYGCTWFPEKCEGDDETNDATNTLRGGYWHGGYASGGYSLVSLVAASLVMVLVFSW